MSSGSVYRERIPLPGWVGPAVGALGGLVTARRVRSATKKGRPAWRRALLLINSLMTVMTVVRLVRRRGPVAVEVEEEFIHIGLGPQEQRIRAHDVRDVRVTGFNPLRFAGVSSGYSGNRAFVQPGVRRGVEIVATGDDGVERTYFIASNSPEALATAIGNVAGVASEG